MAKKPKSSIKPAPSPDELLIPPVAPAKRGRGRPSGYSEKLAIEICEHIARGDSLRQICREEGMPKFDTIARWLYMGQDDFRERYAQARNAALDIHAADVIDIASQTEQHPMMLTKNAGAFVMARRLRFDALRWYLSKLAPKRYGDSVALTGPGGEALPATQNMQTIQFILTDPASQAALHAQYMVHPDGTKPTPALPTLPAPHPNGNGNGKAAG